MYTKEHITPRLTVDLHTVVFPIYPNRRCQETWQPWQVSALGETVEFPKYPNRRCLEMSDHDETTV